MPHVGTICQRLERLEREVRRWKAGATVLGILAGSVLLMGQSVPKSRVIEAEKFVLKDTKGKIRAILGPEWTDHPAPTLEPRVFGLIVVPGHAYGLHLYAEEGRYVAGLTGRGNGEGASLELHDGKTPSSAYVTVGAGRASLNLAATEQTREVAERQEAEWGKRVRAAKTPEERWRLFESRPFDGITATLSAFAKGTSSMYLVRGSSLKTTGGAELRLLRDGRVGLSLTDEKGTTRAVLGHTSLERKRTGAVEQLPASSLVLFDKDGQVIWNAP